MSLARLSVVVVLRCGVGGGGGGLVLLYCLAGSGRADGRTDGRTDGRHSTRVLCGHCCCSDRTDPGDTPIADSNRTAPLPLLAVSCRASTRIIIITGIGGIVRLRETGNTRTHT